MPDAAKNSGSALDSGEGDIVGGIKLGTHTQAECVTLVGLYQQVLLVGSIRK